MNRLFNVELLLLVENLAFLDHDADESQDIFSYDSSLTPLERAALYPGFTRISHNYPLLIIEDRAKLNKKLYKSH